MPTKKRTTASKLVDPDEAPRLDRDWFERAEIREGDRVIRRAKLGRPKKEAPKKAVNIRLDPDVLAHFRAAGPGWQSRINAALRKVARLRS
ncbi:MAG TPA: BrnA antitoxin family protein [Candidatus Cybelea sp.]|nr:BrnA antitoxin family protein [Candidatus Cybelea sp.]